MHDRHAVRYLGSKRARFFGSPARPRNVYAVISSREPQASRPTVASATPPVISLGQCMPAAGTTFLQHDNTGCSVPLLPSFIKIHLSTSDLLTATPMALLKSFKQITPPGSIVNGPPTPPLTADTKISGHIAAILRVFEGCKNGYPPSVPWTVYKLNSEEYEDLQRRLKDDRELWGYVNDRVR